MRTEKWNITIISIKDLTYVYPDGTRALNGVDLDVRENESCALAGRNGAGKSTLLLHLNGTLSAKNGTVMIDGLKADAKNLKKIRRLVGIVFQNPDDMLFFPTVFEDVAFGPRNLGLGEDEVGERVTSALEAVGMGGFQDRNPHHLSIGQKKRTAIAAIISMKPKVIVFDEPTSNLDPRGKKEINELIKSLDCTKIISTHDMELAQECDTVHIIDDGRIVYSGKKPEKSVIERYLM